MTAIAAAASLPTLVDPAAAQPGSGTGDAFAPVLASLLASVADGMATGDPATTGTPLPFPGTPLPPARDPILDRNLDVQGPPLPDHAVAPAWSAELPATTTPIARFFSARLRGAEADRFSAADVTDPAPEGSRIDTDPTPAPGVVAPPPLDLAPPIPISGTIPQAVPAAPSTPAAAPRPNGTASRPVGAAASAAVPASAASSSVNSARAPGRPSFDAAAPTPSRVMPAQAGIQRHAHAIRPDATAPDLPDDKAMPPGTADRAAPDNTPAVADIPASVMAPPVAAPSPTRSAVASQPADAAPAPIKRADASRSAVPSDYRIAAASAPVVPAQEPNTSSAQPIQPRTAPTVRTDAHQPAASAPSIDRYDTAADDTPTATPVLSARTDTVADGPDTKRDSAFAPHIAAVRGTADAGTPLARAVSPREPAPRPADAMPPPAGTVAPTSPTDRPSAPASADLAAPPRPVIRPSATDARAAPAAPPAVDQGPAPVATQPTRDPSDTASAVVASVRPADPIGAAAPLPLATPNAAATRQRGPSTPILAPDATASPSRVAAAGDVAPRDVQPATVIQPALQAFGAALHRAVLAERRPRRDPDIQAIAAPTTSVATATPADPTPLDTTQQRWPEAMVARIEQLRDAQNGADTRIRLHPDALGVVDVTLRQDATGTHVRLHAAEPATARLLADAQPRLQEIAETRGLRLAGSDVTGSQTSGQGWTGSDRRQPAPPSAATANRRPALDPAAADDPADTRIA